MRDFRRLDIWERSRRITIRIYKLTALFPKDELYGITSQTKRAAASIPANIAEGCGRGSSADFARFLHIALGSASELEYFLILCQDLGFANHSECGSVANEVGELKRMLTSLIQKVNGDLRIARTNKAES